MLMEDISESPPAVEPQYRQETVNPPPVIKNLQVAVEKKQKKVPWGCLIISFLVYGATGYSAWIISTPWLAVFGTIVSAITFAISSNWALISWIVLPIVVSWTSATLVFSIMAKGSFPTIWAGVFAIIVFIIVLLTVFIIVVGIFMNFYENNELWTNKLEKNFSRFHSFLILSGTNLIGLGSGWLLGFLLHPKG